MTHVLFKLKNISQTSSRLRHHTSHFSQQYAGARCRVSYSLASTIWRGHTHIHTQHASTPTPNTLHRCTRTLHSHASAMKCGICQLNSAAASTPAPHSNCPDALAQPIRGGMAPTSAPTQLQGRKAVCEACVHA